MKRMLLIGLVVTVGTAAGCSKDDGAAQPKPANPAGNPRLKIAGDAPKTEKATKSAVKE